MNLVGVRAKEKRKQAALKQDELCGRIAHTTKGTWVPTWRDIYRIESGTRLVSDFEVIALAAALECDILWLLGGEGNHTSPQHLADTFFERTDYSEDGDDAALLQEGCEKT